MPPACAFAKVRKRIEAVEVDVPVIKVIESQSKPDTSVASSRVQLDREGFAVMASRGARRMLTAFKGRAERAMTVETLLTQGACQITNSSSKKVVNSLSE